MADIITPVTLESTAENRLCVLLRAQLTMVQEDNILGGHGSDELGDQESTVIIVTVTRGAEAVPNSGLYACDIECEIDMRGDLSDSAVDDIMLEVETALGNGALDIETNLTSGRLHCAAGSAEYLAGSDYSPSDGERFREFNFSAYLGITSA